MPALDGVVERLKRSAQVADIGCGHGASTIVMAQAFPKSSFIGLDYHDASIATARERAAVGGYGYAGQSFHDACLLVSVPGRIAKRANQ